MIKILKTTITKLNITRKDVIYICIIILALLLLKCSSDKNSNLNSELIIRDNNIVAQKATISNYVTKHGEHISTKMSLISDIKDLSKYNDSLEKRIKYISRELNAKSIVYVTHTTSLVHDTIKLNSKISKIDKNEFLINFNKDTIYNKGNERYLSGKLYIITDSSSIKLANFTIDRDEIKFTAEIVFAEKDNKIIASVISSYPGFSTSNIEPVVLDPKLHPQLKKLNNKRFIVGPYIGVGIGQNFSIQPQIGIGICYKIISF